jgi:hypothetical protein
MMLRPGDWTNRAQQSTAAIQRGPAWARVKQTASTQLTGVYPGSITMVVGAGDGSGEVRMISRHPKEWQED